MTMETFKKIVAWTPTEFEIRFSGFVEPFMNPRCAEMILYAKEQNRKVGIFTTLMRASLKDLKKIMFTLSFKKNEDSLIIHLPSNDNTEHFIINDFYLNKLRYVLSIKGDNIDFHYHGKDMQSDVKKVVIASPRKAFFVKLISRSGNVNAQLAPPTEKLKGKIRCSRFDMHGHTILPDGRVALCCNDFGLKHILGDIHKDDYKAIRQSKELKNVFQGQDDESIDILCRKCEFAIPKEVMDQAAQNKSSVADKRKNLEIWRILQKKKLDQQN